MSRSLFGLALCEPVVCPRRLCSWGFLEGYLSGVVDQEHRHFMLALCEDLGPHCPSSFSHKGEVPKQYTRLPSSFGVGFPQLCPAVSEEGGRASNGSYLTTSCLALH